MMTPFLPSSLAPAVVPDKMAHHILVASSSPLLADLLFWMLTLADYQVTCISAHQAMAGTKSAGVGEPALLLVDVHGPFGARQQRNLEQVCTYWKVPLLVLTDDPARVPEPQAHMALLGKPFHLHDLLRLIEELIGPNQEPHHAVRNRAVRREGDPLFPSEEDRH